VFGPVRTRRTFEEAVHQIASAIRSGDVAIGDRLPSERALAATMEISRPTLREAMRLLAKTGLLDVRAGAGGGAFVTSDRVPLELIEQRIDIVASEVSAVLETRRLFEPQVAQLAGVFASEADFRRMRDVVEAQRHAIDNRDRFNQLDERFHITMAQATGNSTVVAVIRSLLGRLAIAFDMDNRWPLDQERRLQIHERTLNAVMLRDPDLIDQAMDEHLSLLERFWAEDVGRGRPRTLPAYLAHTAARRSRA
jgi:GntR family transcriptional regulator, transcriptional repressor for pyruvate dehydrogenase complex